MSTTRPYASGDHAPDAGDGESESDVDLRAPEPVRRLALSGESGIVPRARDFTRQALRDWGWLPGATADRRAAAEDVLLVVSELVTNACLHAGGPEELRLLVNTDPHSPSRFRTDGPLSNLPEFAKAFHIPEGSFMRRSDADRVVIW